MKRVGRATEIATNLYLSLYVLHAARLNNAHMVGERLKVHKTIVTDAGFGLATSQAARHDGVANDGRGRVDNIGTLLFVCGRDISRDGS